MAKAEYEPININEAAGVIIARCGKNDCGMAVILSPQKQADGTVVYLGCCSNKHKNKIVKSEESK